ncbi:MAG: hypothetical protein Q7J54_04615 [Candidatus Woesearchaeota archaeon]|nr:hypothetical protein [Candidatus Woesearchaeota archaeon]
MIRPQLMEDVYGGKVDYWLNKEQTGFLQGITRTQLQEDIYLSMAEQTSFIEEENYSRVKV